MHRLRAEGCRMPGAREQVNSGDPMIIINIIIIIIIITIIIIIIIAIIIILYILPFS